jgi:hypothetical protein
MARNKNHFVSTSSTSSTDSVDMDMVEQQVLVDQVLEDLGGRGIVFAGETETNTETKEADLVDLTDIDVNKGWDVVDTTSDQIQATVAVESAVDESAVLEPITVVGSTISAALDAYLMTLPSKSARIRYLDSLGYRRAVIAKHLNILYQHVRNVLTQVVKRPVGHDQVRPNTASAPTELKDFTKNTSQLVASPEEMAINKDSYEPGIRLMG